MELKNLNPTIRPLILKTALIDATYKQNSDLMEKLLLLGANPDVEVKTFISPLYYAVGTGNVSLVTTLIKCGVNLKDNFSTSEALNLAAQKENYEIIKLMVEAGADINCTGNNHLTPIHSTFLQTFVDSSEESVKNKCKLVKYMISKGATPDLPDKEKNKSEKSLLSKAIAYDNLDIIEILLKSGADPNGNKNDREAPLIRAASSHLKNSKKIIQLLLDYGADINSLGGSDEGPIYTLLQTTDCVEFIKYLLEQGCRVFQEDLEAAAENGNYDLFESVHEKLSKIDYSELLDSAAIGGNPRIFSFIFNRGTNDDSFYNAALEACENGHLEIVKFYFNKISLKKHADNAGELLIQASFNGHMDIIQFILSRGVDINFINEYEESPLTVASMGNHLAVVEFLLENGADINQVENSSNKNSFFWACSNCNFDMARLLIEKGISTDLMDDDGKHLMESTITYSNMDITCLLVEKNLYPENRAVIESLFQAIATSGHVQLMEQLLTGEPKPEKDKLLGQALISAIKESQIDMVEFLLNNGVNVKKYGGEALIESCRLTPQSEKGLSITKLLLNHKANINYTNKKGYTPLKKALDNYSDQDCLIADFLLTREVRVNGFDENMMTPLHYAVERNKIDIVKKIIGKGARINRRIKAFSILKFLILFFHNFYVYLTIFFRKGKEFRDATALAYLNSKITRDTPLLTAIRTQNRKSNYDIEIINYLLENGADPNIAGLYGDTPLILASKGSSYEVVEMLLNKGADTTTYNESGVNALIAAIKNGNTSIVELLLQNGADPNEKALRINFQIPLIIAAWENHFDISSLLLDYGADPSMKSSEGETVMEVTSNPDIKILITKRDQFKNFYSLKNSFINSLKKDIHLQKR